VVLQPFERSYHPKKHVQDPVLEPYYKATGALDNNNNVEVDLNDGNFYPVAHCSLKLVGQEWLED
jgi:hypothetical protein